MLNFLFDVILTAILQLKYEYIISHIHLDRANKVVGNNYIFRLIILQDNKMI